MDDFMKAAVRFEQEEINKTIVFYGSHSIDSWDSAQQKMREVEILFEQSKRRSQKQWDALDKASNAVYMSRYYDAAEQLAFKFSQWSESKFKKRKDKYILCSGGGPGIMEATNKGAYRANAPSIGLGIDLQDEQEKNQYITPNLKFFFHYFFVRKFWFLYHVQAIVVFPGGFGTLDELFDILNLIKTKKKSPYIPIVLYGSEFWKKVINFEPMVHHGTIDAENVAMIHHSDSIEDTFSYIISQLEKHHSIQDLS